MPAHLLERCCQVHCDRWLEKESKYPVLSSRLRLVKNTPDSTHATALRTILLQSRISSLSRGIVLYLNCFVC